MITDNKYNLTYHHIQKEAEGGEKTVENGALMTDFGQAWLHNQIEPRDRELFDLINECLLLYKAVMDLEDVDLIRQYREEVIPLFRDAVIKYNNFKAPTHRKQKKLQKRFR